MNKKLISGAAICLIGVAMNIYHNTTANGMGCYKISVGAILVGLGIILNTLVDEKRSRENREFMEKATWRRVAPEDWLLKGVDSFRFQEYGEAIHSFDEALKIDPDYADAWINKGSAFHELGMYREAIAAYDQVIRIQPQNASAWKRKGFAFKKLDQNADATIAFSKAEELGYNS